MRLLFVSIISLAICCGIITWQELKITRLSKERAQLISFARRDSSLAADYLNKYGHQVRRTEETELTLRNAQQLAGTERLAFLKELQGVKQNLRNLETAVSLQARTTADLKLRAVDTVIVVKGDSIHAHKFGYVDQYNLIKGILQGDTTALVSVKINVPIEGAVFWQRSRILGLRIGRKKYFSEFTSPNRWVKISGVESIKIQRR